MKIALPWMDSTNCLLSSNARFVGECAGKLAVRDERVAMTLSAEPFFDMGQICTIQPSDFRLSVYVPFICVLQ